MGFKSIRSRMLVWLVPVIAAALVLLTVIAAYSSSKNIDSQLNQTMNATIESNANQVLLQLKPMEAQCISLAAQIETAYQILPVNQLASVVTSMLEDVDSANGGGIWFEPYAYSPEEQYTCPFAYRDDSGKLAVSYTYVQDSGEYYDTEWYSGAKNAEAKTAVITAPYYDSTAGITMVTYSSPMHDKNGKFIGCVTIDISMKTISEMIGNVKVGSTGTAMLTSADGTYIAGTTDDNVANGVKITEDSNSSLAKAAAAVLANEEGQTSFTSGGKNMRLYYDTIPGLGWKLMIQIQRDELVEPIAQMTTLLLLVCIIAIAATTIIVIWQVNGISKNIKSVQQFSDGLAAGDLTIDQLKVKSKDELGKMGSALNAMYGSNREMIGNIADHSEKMSRSSIDLENASAELNDKFEAIKEYMEKINEATTSSSAATEEVNASAEEVNASMTTLAGETSESVKAAEEIKKRAAQIEEESMASTESARKLSEQFETQLSSSIENSKVVENIGQMADVIAGIAEQINLLSLNASIEAARAGEAGKGFAVVADEIGKLANETSTAVKNIQDTVQQVQDAFSDLSDNSKGLLGFVTDTVMPDYGKFTETASQYGKDAEYFASISEKVSSMSDDVEEIMKQVSLAIQNIAESSQDTADISSNVLSSVEEVSGTVTQVSDMSHDQQTIADDLDNVVKKFKL